MLVVKSSRSLCTVRRLFLTPGDTLPASPLLGSKMTAVFIVLQLYVVSSVAVCVALLRPTSSLYGQAYRPKFVKHPMSTPFFRDRSRNFGARLLHMNPCQAVDECFTPPNPFPPKKSSPPAKPTFVNGLAGVHGRRAKFQDLISQETAWTF